MHSEKSDFQLLEHEGIPYKKIDHDAIYTIKEMDQLGPENLESIAKICLFRMIKRGSIFFWC